MAQYDLNLRDYWRVIKKRKFIIVFTILSMGIFSLLFSLLWRPIPLYKATASIKIERSGSITGLYLETVSWSQTDYMQTQASVIKSYYIIEIAAKRLGLIPPELSSEEIHANKKYQTVILEIRDSIKTEQEGYSNILNISVTSKEPKFSRQLANTIAHVFKEQHILELNRRTFEAKKFIENQLDVVKKRLRDSEEAVKHFRETNELISLDGQTSTLLNQKSVLQATYEKALTSREKIEEITKLLKMAERSPITSKNSYYIDEASTLYKSLNDQLVRLILERDTFLLTYTEEYPRVVELNKKIRETLSNMMAQLSLQYNNVQESSRDLNGRIGTIEQRIKQLPELGLELARLEEQVQVNREVYLLLEKKYQESLIKEAEKIEEVQIVKPALEPTKPVNPPKTNATTAVGILLGLILGVVFAFIVETFDTSIGAIEEVEEMTGVNALGIIPHVGFNEVKETIAMERPGRDIDDKTAERYARILSHFAPKSTLAESYRALRTNLKFVGLKDDMKNILFTSSSPQEGKSTVVANLAITMAQDGKKVLLIDGDMRKPMIAHIFGIEQTSGLADIILGNYSWRDVVRTVSDVMMGKMSVDDVMMTPGMDNLNIITSGSIPSNPSELVSADTINQIINEAKSEYDLILWDAPPILSATDAAILSSKMDGVVMVYRVGRIARNTLKRAKTQLDNVHAHVIGVVLNGLKAEISPDFTKHDYYRYYDYYNGRDHKKRKTALLQEIQAVSSKISAYLKKTGKEDTEKKGSSLKNIIFLIIFLLLCFSILYQLGFLNISRSKSAVRSYPDDHRIDTMVEETRSLSEKQGRTDVRSETTTVVITKNPVGESDVKTPETRTSAPPVKAMPVSKTDNVHQPDGEKKVAANEEVPIEKKEALQQEEPATVRDNEGVLPNNAGGKKTEDTIVEPAEDANKREKITIEKTPGKDSAYEKKSETILKYTIQIGSFQVMDNAKRLAVFLDARGFDVQWRGFPNARGKWFRVIVGRFEEKKDAIAFMKKNEFDAIYPNCRIFQVAFSNAD